MQHLVVMTAFYLTSQHSYLLQSGYWNQKGWMTSTEEFLCLLPEPEQQSTDRSSLPAHCKFSSTSWCLVFQTQCQCLINNNFTACEVAAREIIFTLLVPFVFFLGEGPIYEVGCNHTFHKQVLFRYRYPIKDSEWCRSSSVPECHYHENREKWKLGYCEVE